MSYAHLIDVKNIILEMAGCKCDNPEIHTDENGINYCKKCKVETELLRKPNKLDDASDAKYLYYHLDFYKDGLYQHECYAEDLDDVRGYLQWWEVEFDDEDTKAEIRIKGVGLTRAAFEEFKKEQKDFPH
jgi:hypothetical protein